MRALVVHPGPEYSVADVYTGWVKGLRELGIQTQEYNLHDRLNFFAQSYHKTADGDYVKSVEGDDVAHLAASGLKQACYDWWPDLVVVVSGFFIHPLLLDVMRDRGHKVAAVFTESPYEDDRQLEQCDRFDAVVVNDPTNLDQFLERNPNSLYLPHCFDPYIHRPGRSDYKSDVAFVGTAYPSRRKYLERVDWTGIDLALAGNWKDVGPPLSEFVIHDPEDCLPNDQTALVYRGTKASFNLYRTEASAPELSEGWAMGPREVELAATGTWFARQSRPESDELFPMLPIFESPAELGDQLRWAIAHESERLLAARKARAVVADRTFDANARRLLSALGV